MRLKKSFWIGILLGVFVMTSPGLSQVKAERAVTFSGFIESVPKDFKYIVLYEQRVFTGDATIVDDNGIVLKISDLKPKFYVTVEGIQKPDGVFAKKIMLIRAPKVPKSRLKKP